MSMPTLHEVDSTCVARMGFDEQAEEAYVEYHGSSQVYVYVDVPAAVFDEFERAESKGAFVNEVIKPGYRFRKL